MFFRSLFLLVKKLMFYRSLFLLVYKFMFYRSLFQWVKKLMFYRSLFLLVYKLMFFRSLFLLVNKWISYRSLFLLVKKLTGFDRLCFLLADICLQVGPGSNRDTPAIQTVILQVILAILVLNNLFVLFLRRFWLLQRFIPLTLKYVQCNRWIILVDGKRALRL